MTTDTQLKSESQSATCNLQPSTVLAGASPSMPLAARDEHQLDSIVAAKPMSPPGEPRKIRRNGRVACLPRVYRDMVNRMLWNAVPYKTIAAALDDEGYPVTERNISNWATGGYLEWRLSAHSRVTVR